jgi:hypothetical protein
LLGNTRIVPDTLIIIGAIALLLFMIKAMRHLKPVTIESGTAYPVLT